MAGQCTNFAKVWYTVVVCVAQYTIYCSMRDRHWNNPE